MSSRAIQFYFRGEVQQVEAISPTRTVLQYLREDCHHTGTKEGCAEGDCGACTVVVGELDSLDGKERLQLRTVNSCIQFLPTLDGKALFTVEDLAQIQALQTLKDTHSPVINALSAHAASKTLHPIQQAMVDHHASQCGFCTPGFVMSLWAMYENQTHAPTRTEATEHISGNLCRCTGYRPILDAAIAAYDLPRVTLEREPIISTLKALEALPALSYHIAGQRFFAPRTRAELAALRIEYPQARLLAGSTDVGLWITKQGRQLSDVIYLGHVTDLKKIDHQDAYIEIGAMVSLTDAFAELSHLDTGWTELARRFASEPIKNAGTLGGNVANGSPIGDSMPCLMALGATLVLRRGDKTRTVALDQFYTGQKQNVLQPGEFIEAIECPKPVAGQVFRAHKVSKRFEQDISATCAAISYQLQGGKLAGVKLAYNGLAPAPCRAPKLEAVLEGKAPQDVKAADLDAAIAASFTARDGLRATWAYRSLVARNLVLEFIEEQTSEVA